VAYAVNGRFNPAQNAMMYSPDGSLDVPLTKAERRAHAKSLEELLREEDAVVADQNNAATNSATNSATWREVQTKAVFAPDAAGYPALSMPQAETAAPANAQVSPATEPSLGQPAVGPFPAQPTMMVIGLTRENILASTAPAAFTRDLLVTRLRQELSAGTSPHTSERQFRADLTLLENLFVAQQNQTIAGGGFIPSAER
jgi:hypothetical protein